MGHEGPGGVLWHRPQVARFAKGRKLCVECVMPNVSLSTVRVQHCLVLVVTNGKWQT